MKTKEQWKAGILIAGMLIIAIALRSLQIERHPTQSQASPAYRPPPAPVAATPVEPQYPIHKLIPVNQDGWNEELGFDGDERVEWHLVEDNVWLDNRVNRIEEFRGFPRNDSRSMVIPIHEIIRTLQFRVTPGTPVKTGTVDITIRKNTPVDFNTKENILSPVTPSLTATGAKAGPQWPSELTPTRTIWLPPDGFAPGTQIADTIFPIEDVFYRIKNGWTISPRAESGPQSIQTAPVFANGENWDGLTQSDYDCVGFRIRVLNPNNPVIVHFGIVSAKNQNQNSNPQRTGQPPYTSQGVPNRYSTQTPPPATRPVVRPYVVPRQPSYYSTSPTGPSYYPSQHNP